MILADRLLAAPPLDDAEVHLLWTLGKAAALAAVARIVATQAEKAHQLEQRIDLAREIHEGVIQRLFGVSMALDGEGDLPAEARERCASETQRALSDLRTALQRPLGRAPRATGTTFVAEVERLSRVHPELGVRLESGREGDVPTRLEPLAQSVLAEAVRNAHKHASPTRVSVRVGQVDGAFVLEVANDGVAGRRRQAGMGLRLAALEALQSGGVVEFGERDPGSGRYGWWCPAMAEQLRSPDRLTVLVVDDHDVVHWGFRLMLTQQAWVERCVSAHSGPKAIEMAVRYRPHVALVDLFLGEESGAEICEQIRTAEPRTRVLLFSGAGEISPQAARAAGASGFAYKDWPARRISSAVRLVGLGKTMFERHDRPGVMGLSDRERSVLELMASGSTNPEIAEALHLSKHTVKEHTSAVYRKLGVRNRTEAVQRAQRLGLVS